jgi:hypothetical protein
MVKAVTLLANAGLFNSRETTFEVLDFDLTPDDLVFRLIP